MSASTVLIAMGVTGVGKTTVARALCERLHWTFKEGDDLHPPSNIQKMHAGIPLDDADRGPWLAAIRAWIDASLQARRPGIVTCSALKRRYRGMLTDDRPSVRILYLRARTATIRDRIEKRTGHFMPASLLDSQLQILEEPVAEEHAITVTVEKTVEETVDDAVEALRRNRVLDEDTVRSGRC